MDYEAREWLNRHLADLDLSVRASNCLEALGLRTVRDLCVCSEVELLSSRLFGDTCLREVEAMLDRIGLRLGMTTRDLEMGDTDSDDE